MNFQLAEMAEATGRATSLLKALAHPHRLMILCRLVQGEASVGELAALLDLRGSTTSQHLALLRRDGLIRPRRDAQSIRYAIASDEAREVMHTLFRLYCNADPGRAPPPPSPPAPKRRRAKCAPL